MVLKQKKVFEMVFLEIDTGEMVTVSAESIKKGYLAAFYKFNNIFGMKDREIRFISKNK